MSIIYFYFNITLHISALFATSDLRASGHDARLLLLAKVDKHLIALYYFADL